MINGRTETEGTYENYERLKRIRAGNRAVVTKLEREAADIIKVHGNNVSEDHISKLDSCTTTLKTKQKCLAELDDQILAQCDFGEIEKEIEESTEVSAKIEIIVSA